MQRVSGAIVKVPDSGSQSEKDEVPVTIIGHFYAAQSAQRRIRALMMQTGPQGPGGAPGMLGPGGPMAMGGPGGMRPGPPMRGPPRGRENGK
jgi:hypothetical protein